MGYTWDEIVAMPEEIMDYFELSGIHYYYETRPIRISRRLKDISEGSNIAIATVPYNDIGADYGDKPTSPLSPPMNLRISE